MPRSPHDPSSFFFNDTATTEIYTLSLHDALPIWDTSAETLNSFSRNNQLCNRSVPDRKSTRLNSSHFGISYAVFCLKKNKHNIGAPHTLSHTFPRPTRANTTTPS